MKKIVLFLVLSLVCFSLFGASISGFIAQKENGEPVLYATVLLKGTNIGAYSNKKGYFVISNIPPGEYELFVSLIGFKPFTQKIVLADNNSSEFLKVEIEVAAIQMEEIVVREEKYEDFFSINAKEIKVATIRQSTQDIQNVPQIADADIFKALQLLPGVSSMADFSSGLYVRGGTQDQNLILIDETDVYNPTHFGGIFSTFCTDAIENVELMKGGFPAKYGGRLSSVLDVTNKNGNRKEFAGVARISLISASATVEGPWKYGSYMGSFRRTYLDLIKNMLNLNFPDYYFYDGHAKINWDVSGKDKSTTSVYFGKDKLEMDYGTKLIVSWGNETATTQWIHIFKPELFSHFMLAGSHYGSLIATESDGGEEFRRENHIYDLTFKAMFTYTPNENHHIDFGLDEKYNLVDYFVEIKNSDLDISGMPDVKTNSYLNTFYIQDSWDFTPLWTVQPGLRFSYFHSSSEDLPSAKEADYLRVSPRLSLRYKTSVMSSVFFNCGRYYQYLTSLNLGVSSPVDLWFPLDGDVKPGESDHYILGFNTQINENFAFDLEGYYKDYRNLVEFRPETDYEWNNETGTLRDVYNIGKGYSYGADVLLRTKWNHIEGFVGYSYGITKRKIENVNIDPETNEERWYFPKYDRTHQVNLVETFNVSDIFDWKPMGSTFKLSTSYSLYSGQPYGKPEQMYISEGYPQTLMSYSDSYRLPAYNRLDISLKFLWETKSMTIEPYLEVINLLNQDNIWSITTNPVIDETTGDITLDEFKSTMFPLIPFLGVNIKW